MELVLAALSIAVLGLFFVLAIPLAALGLVVGLFVFALWQLIALPLRLIGWTVALGAGVIVISVKLFLLLLLIPFVVLALFIGFLPLLPFVLVLVGLWLIFRPGRAGRGQAGGRPATT